KRGLYGGGGIDARIGPQPSIWALRAAEEGPSWGAGYKARLAEFSRSMVIAGHGTSLPVATNSVSLDPQLKDAWGLPAIRVTYRDHPDDLANARFLQDLSVEIAEAAGALKVARGPIAEQDFSMHLLGTCRMAHEPNMSLIDRYARPPHVST